jgi:hypothetical protein
MRSLLQRLIFFTLLFEGLYKLNLATLVTGITVVIAMTAFLRIPLIVNTSSGIMNTDSGQREHSPERSDGLGCQFKSSESISFLI